MKCSKLIFVLLCIIPISILILSCSPTEPEKQKPEVSLEDVSCTEAWLNVKGETGSEIILDRDGKEIQRFTLAASPQTIYDDSLQPNKAYKYSITTIRNQESSNKLMVTTLDTTSHNFSWQTFTFGGDAGSCTLFDVAIIDENNIWAVGEIFVADTSEDRYTTYGAAHWNGSKWELKKIYYKDKDYYGKEFIMPLSNIRGIFAFSSTDIWFAAGSIFHWDGIDSFAVFTYRTLTPSGLQPGIIKLWGSNNNDIYGVGRSGTIIHYENGQWHKIESGTELTINDIYGAYNKQNGQYEILAPASNVLESFDRDLLKISGNSVSHLSTAPVSSTLSSIWFKPNVKYFFSGDGIYLKNGLNESGWKNKPTDITSYYTYRIRGNNLNDVAAVGGLGEVIHFNGIRWHSYFENTKLLYGNYYGLDFKNNIIAAVGQENRKAVIILGRR